MTSRAHEIRDNVARVLAVRRPVAWRIVRWLRERLHEEADAIQGEAAIVPFRSESLDVGALVATVDFSTYEVGCAWCGLFIASHGEALVEGTRAIQLDPAELPRELQELRLRPAILYCAECWPTLAPYLRERLGIEEPAP